MSTIKMATWVSTRFFQPNVRECRAAISNEFDHEFLVLEDESAVLWNAIVDCPNMTAEEISSKLNYPLDEVNGFVKELVQAHLLLSSDAIVNEDSIHTTVISDIATSGRYQSGGYEEPVPGGDNLEAEFEFQDWAKAHGYLWAASWEITFRCNEACIHCFNPGAAHSVGQRAYRKTEEMTRLEWQQMLREMKDLGVFRLMLTGGEVALHKDFFDILTEARQMGFAVTIFTNGTLFDRNELDQLTALYLHRVELSIYAPSSAQHDPITLLPGSYEKTLIAARHFIKAGITVALKMIVMQNTVDQVSGFRALCAKLECESIVDFNMSPGVDGAREPLKNLLPTAMDLIAQASVVDSPLYIGTIDVPRRMSWKGLEAQPVCGAGRSIISISPEGNIYPCNSLPIHVGSVRETGLTASWRSSKLGGGDDSSNKLTAWQNVNRGDYHVCGNFARCDWCQKCPGMALLENGDELSPSTVNCRNAAARLVAHALLSEGRDACSVDADELVKLQLQFSENTALWQVQEHISTRIDLDTVQKSLRQRGKIGVLMKDPISG